MATAYKVGCGCLAKVKWSAATPGRRPMTIRWLDRRAAMGGRLLLAVCALPAAANDKDKAEGFVIRTLSNRADLISGGDALVEVTVPRHVRLDWVAVSLNDRDI